MKKYQLLLLSFLFQYFAFSQENQSIISRVKINEIQTSISYSSDQANSCSLTDFIKLAPLSNLLKINLSNYSNNYNEMMPISIPYSLLISLKFSDKSRTKFNQNSTVRIGLNYLKKTNLIANYFNSTSNTYDTLTSSQNSQIVYFDSVIENNLKLKHSSENLRFDAAYIYRIRPVSRWSFLTGIGFTLGMVMNSQTSISMNTSNRIETYYSTNPSALFNSYATTYINRSELYKNKNSYGFSAYIPIGIDFRIGKRNDFLNHTHLFYELRADLNVTSIPELRNYINTRTQHGVGIRITFN
jgi:hypothetical protein